MTERTIQLGHGGGGRLSRDLIREQVLSRFGEGPLRSLPDAALLPWKAKGLVFSTDSFVVNPLRFPGGSIGHLAVHGTVNDLAVSGARPLWLSLALILEEGLPFAVLAAVLDDVQAAARDCQVGIATGDTKVVGRGQCDGMYICTSGVGEPLSGFALSPRRIQVGDRLLVSGPLGDHGVAIMAAREGIRIGHPPQSDTASVHRLVLAVAQGHAEQVRLMRDPTRGGLAAVLNEWVEDREIGIRVQEKALPFSPGARAVAETLGLDLLQVPSEGRMLLMCAPEAAEAICKLWREMPEGRDAAIIGEATAEAGRVVIQTAVGGRRLIDIPQGELLPRIC